MKILLTLSLAAFCLAQAGENKPNVILILSDDHGFTPEGKLETTKFTKTHEKTSYGFG